ncbi:MAG: ATP-binding protein [Thermoproteales archaeon]|nr:ATP-binding protein [Thermoproteales archaeon]
MEKILIRNIDIDRWRKTGRRVLVYGRRKVGKSFFVKNFTKWDRYFFVKRDGGIIDLGDGREVSYEYLKDILLRDPREKIVIDEFHRLPEDFLDLLHAYGEKLNLVLITSTLWLAQRIFSEDSPILGIFQRFKMELIDERDILVGLSDMFSGRKLIEAAVYLREPWLIPMIQGEVRTEIPRIIYEEKDTVERLVGEVFREEERSLKKSYIAILNAVSSGKRRSGELSSHLYSRRIIPRDDPSIIQGHLRTLVNIGLLEKLKIPNRRFDQYLHKSPVTDLYFYLDSKYGFSELEIPLRSIEKVFQELLPRHVEQYLRNLLSKIYGMTPAKIIESGYDVDIVLLDLQRIKLVGEVKWRKDIERKELRKIEAILSGFKGAKRILIVPEKTSLPYTPEDIEVWDVEDILEITRSHLKAP